MFRRRPLMRAAVVGGGAYMAGKHVANSQADAAAADSGTSSMIDQLNQLAALHQQGVLSDDEFTAAKAKLFGS